MSVKAPPVSEREWQSTVLELARSLGWRSMHVRTSRGKNGHATTTSVVGWPDLVLWSETQRRVLFAELKSETGQLSDQQDAVLASLRAAGQEVAVWRPADFDAAVAVLRGAPPVVLTPTPPAPATETNDG